MSIILSKDDLARIEYDPADGFYVGDFYFDTLIRSEDTFLRLERSILTTEGIVITWIICEGWIVLPRAAFTDKINYTQFTPLSLYLNALFNKSLDYERQMTCKEQLIDEMIETLKERIATVQQYLIAPENVSPDEMIFIIKEHRHPNLQDEKQLLVVLEKELNSWYVTKRKVMENGLFEANAFIAQSPSVRTNLY